MVLDWIPLDACALTNSESSNCRGQSERHTHLRSFLSVKSPIFRFPRLLLVNAGDETRMAAAISSPSVFVSIDEKRIPSPPGCIIKFYLVDCQGRRHLAGMGEATSGEANLNFTFLDVRVVAW